MKASHDSLTGYPLRDWILYPLNWMAMTQTKTLQEQLNEGVQYLDLRFRHIDGELFGAHGLLVYKITAKEVFQILSDFCRMTTKNIYFRVILEDGLFRDDIPVTTFKFRINQLLKGCPNNLIIHRCGLKSDWSGHTIYTDIKFFGKCNYSLTPKQIRAKIEEMQYQDLPCYTSDSYVYECYTYKGFPFPWLSNRLIRKHIPDNSMRNFI